MQIDPIAAEAATESRATFTANPKALEAAAALFVARLAGIELDDLDARCIHAVAFDVDDKPIGTGRLLPDGHIGRMAVVKDWRRRGIGAEIEKDFGFKPDFEGAKHQLEKGDGAGNTFKATAKPVLIGTAVVAADGTWSLPLAAALADNVVLSATQVDPAGNTSAPSTAQTFTVDTTGPSQETVDPLNPATGKASFVPLVAIISL